MEKGTSEQETQGSSPSVIPPTQTTNSYSFGKPKRKILKLLIIGIVLLPLVVGGIVASYSYPQTQKSEQIACTMDAKVCPDGSVVGRTGSKCEFSPCPLASSQGKTTNSNVNWKTFENTFEKYSVNYQSDWFLQIKGYGDSVAFRKLYTELGPQVDQHVSIKIHDNPTEDKLNDWVSKNVIGFAKKEYKKQSIKDNIKQRLMEIDKISFIAVTGAYLPAINDSLHVYFKSNNKIVEMFLNPYSSSLDNENDFDKKGSTILYRMIPTFKFADSQTVDTSNWKIYTNEKYGFSFKYDESFTLVERETQRGTLNNTEEVYLRNHTDETQLTDKNATSILVSVREVSGDIDNLEKWLEDEKIAYSGISGTDRTTIRNLNKTKVANLDAIVYESGAEDTHKNVLFYKEKKLVQFTLFATGETGSSYKDLPPASINFDQILSTFKFTDDTDSSTLQFSKEGESCGKNAGLAGDAKCASGLTCKYTTAQDETNGIGTCVAN